MNEYNPRILWDELKLCFDHTESITLPTACHDWINLKVQDHTTIANYNNELFCIVSQLTVYGHLVGDEEHIKKTLSTFHTTNLILAS